MRKQFNRRTAKITIEHRNSWGDELRCNLNRRLLSEATTSNRSWFIVITMYFEDDNGCAYFDEYMYHFQSCTLTDQKSIDRFDAIRDHILSSEKNKANLKHYRDWGWFATPWESRYSYCKPEDAILIANFK